MRSKKPPKVYVGNLSFQAVSDDVHALFADFDVHGVSVVTDPVTGRARGFAFVEFLRDEDADAAVSAKNGTEHMGRRLMVSRAIEKPR